MVLIISDKIALLSYCVFLNIAMTSACCKNPVQCDPATTCNGHGTCQEDGSCKCSDGFYGDSCSRFGTTFATFGGFVKAGTRTDQVMLINVETTESCLHSKLPVVMKETFVFDFKDTLLVCSSETKSDQENLQCFIWDVSNKIWTEFETPSDNGVYGFISAVRIPGKGIWFFTNRGNEESVLDGSRSLFLDEETGSWKQELFWTNNRKRACSVQINDNVIAHIGGEVFPNPSANSDLGFEIDTYDVENQAQTLSVARMNFNRKQFSCALISKGLEGNPTVAILGDNSEPYPDGMELWDTATNTITKVDHPPGFEGPNSRFFRPVMSTFGDDSILLTGSKIFTGESDEISYMNEIFQYQVGTGWINLGQLGTPIDAKEQYGIYAVDEAKKNTFDILEHCA